MNNDLKDVAVEFIKNGYQIIPVNEDKKPLVPWIDFLHLKNKVTEEMLSVWYDQFRPNGIALILNGTNLVVVDVDCKDHELIKKLSYAPHVETGKGFHFYFTLPNKENLADMIRVMHNVDIKTNGLIILPPSIHKNGWVYRWIRPLDGKPPELPDLIKDLIKKESNQKTGSLVHIRKILEGNRHNEFVKLAGKLLGKFSTNDFSLAHDILQAMNHDKCEPPMDASEVTSIFDSISKKELDNRKPQIAVKLLTVGQIYDMEIKQNEFVVEHLVPHGITSLSGHPGVGKSWVMFELAKSIATGSDFLGKFKTKKMNIAIIDGESGNYELKRRLKMMRIDPDVPINLYSTSDLIITDESNQQNLANELTEKNIGLVIFDPLVSFHTSNENSADEMQKVMKALQQFTKNGIAVVFIHHHRKETVGMRSDAGQGMRGSSVVFSRVDSALVVKSMQQKGDVLEMTISHDKLRSGKKHDPFTVLLEDKKDGLALKYGEDAKVQSKKDDIRDAVFSMLEEQECKRTEIISVIEKEGLGKSRTIDLVLKDMEKAGEIKSRTEHGVKLYVINSL